MQNLKRFVLATLILLSIIVGVLYFMPQYSTESISPDHSLAIDALSHEFTQNENKANSTYIGKVIETEGYIQDISYDVESSPVILVSAKTYSKPLILSTFEQSESSKIKNLSPGDKIKFKGQCTGKLLEIVFKNGILLD